MQEIISTREAANRLEVSTRTITRAIHAGVFRAKYGGLYKNRIVGVYTEDVAELERRATQVGYIDAGHTPASEIGGDV